jgi:hypothetical protein
MAITESVFINVGLHVLGANRMVDAGDTAFDQTPKALNAIRMNVSLYVNLMTVRYAVMLVAMLCHGVITGVIVCKKGGFFRHVLFNKRYQCKLLGVSNNTGLDVALALYRADYDGLTECGPTTKPLALAADVSLVDFNFTHQSASIVSKERPDLVEHAPSGFVGDASFTLDLFSGDTATCRGHLVDSLKPSTKGRTGLVEDGVSQRGYLMAAGIAFIHWTLHNLVMLRDLATLRTVNTVRPTVINNPVQASIIGWERLVKVFSGVFIHNLNPLQHVVYHEKYMMSRDNYLNISPSPLVPASPLWGRGLRGWGLHKE